MERDWHTRSHTLSQSMQRPRDSQRAGSWPLTLGGGAGSRDGIGQPQVPHGVWALARAEPAGPTGPNPRPCTAPPPHLEWGDTGKESPRDQGPCHPSCSLSAIALISENLQECSSDGITWNCSFGGKTNHKVFRVRYWSGWGSCVLGFLFFFCYFCFCFVF